MVHAPASDADRQRERGLKGQVDTREKAEAVLSLDSDDLVLRAALGGALNWYERKAA